VLAARFDRPAALFAPNPGVRKKDNGVPYNYIRPLATIEPTAIRLGLPVNTDIGLDELDALQAAITSPAYRDATVFVSWEHRLVAKMAAQLLPYGHPAQVPDGITAISTACMSLLCSSRSTNQAVSGWKSRD
jgi:hypothetical protein